MKRTRRNRLLRYKIAFAFQWFILGVITVLSILLYQIVSEQMKPKFISPLPEGHVPSRTIVQRIYAAEPGKKYADERSNKLAAFLKSKNSPLEPHASLIVTLADKYDIGWTKLVAISAIESNYGKIMPQGSHNAWGLGGARFMHFDNWEEGITYASQLIGNNYQWNANRGIQTKYCPDSDNCNPAWPEVVTKASKDIISIK